MTWPRVTGVASWRWVRPSITTSALAAAFARSVSRRPSTAGMSAPSISSTVAMCITVGNASFDDCERFTSSFGWIGALPPRPAPASSLARPAMTSFAFMFVWVPEPVWKTTSGNSPSSRPSATSRAAVSMSAALSGASWPSSRLARAADSLRIPRARITGRPQVNRPTPIRKFSTERWVWAPQ